MAITQTIKCTCPKCQKKFEAKAYKSINGTLEPEAKEKLISTQIFNFICPDCNELFSTPHALEYRDMEKEYVLFLNNDDEEEIDLVKNVEEMFPNYKIRVTYELFDLLEKMHIFEANLNDKIITYLDNKIYEDITGKLAEQQSPIQVNKILFDSFDLKQKKINFGALSNSQRPIFIHTPYSDYKNLANSPGFIRKFKEIAGDYRIDRNWAVRV